jgi:hypothetical protein
MPQTVLAFPKDEKELEDRFEAYIAKQPRKARRSEIVRSLIRAGLEVLDRPEAEESCVEQ